MGFEPPLELAKLRNSFILEEAVSRLRHDLRNNLAAVRNAGFFVRRKLEKDAGDLLSAQPRLQEMLGIIDEQVSASEHRLASTLGDSPNLEEIRVADVVASLVAALDAPVPITLEDRSAARVVFANRSELELAVFCLIHNAVDAAVEGDGSGVVVICEAVADQVAILVIDPGPGFGETAERALQPFFTTKGARFGLGLNIARRAAARMGGRLELVATDDDSVRPRMLVGTQP